MAAYAKKCGAIDLGIGVPGGATDFSMIWDVIKYLLGGSEEGGKQMEDVYLDADTLQGKFGKDSSSYQTKTLKDLLRTFQHPKSTLSQYSMPEHDAIVQRAISGYYKYHYEMNVNPSTEIIVTLGSTTAITILTRVLASPGDNVVVFEPYHELYKAQLNLQSVNILSVLLREDKINGWVFDMTELEEAIAQPNVKFLILNSPHNPTGKIFTLQELEKIADLVCRYKIYLLSDEIYEHFIFNSSMKHHCLFDWNNLKGRAFTVNSLSKTACITGWRIGWILSPPEFTASLKKAHTFTALQTPTPFQLAVVPVLRSDISFFNNLRDSYAKRRNILCDALVSVGFYLPKNDGSFYIFVRYDNVSKLRGKNSVEAANFLVTSIGVACIAGKGFYQESSESQFLRFAFCGPTDAIIEASHRLLRLKD
ncbi:putative Kynurenine--oxoglutarate transaminase [Cardiosporidium cionae]|uniref:Kynurenine--oxoglutarate transaminase n=1 Tax=Cardiosporidium cionae TaxID=476202 RepID=A0ABQ7J5B0_9APIC|nr:putative Kynurenine--oxoglutarate transaminase [Cardiosporidium cionae]|eukprot:KAF8819178.1 putative Kynurenine--oxoglutarate transaminase [Cardiosporidium cionae]